MTNIIAYNNLLKILKDPTKKIFVILQRFGRGKWINNYGEIPKYINAADGDPWDILVPGYPMMETTRSFRLKELLGVYQLPNGNHKLIIDIYDTMLSQDKSRIRTDIIDYKRKYEARTGLRGKIIYF